MTNPIHLKSKPLPFTLITISALFFLSPSIFAQGGGGTATKKKPAPGFEIIEHKSSPQVGILIEYFKLDHRTANKLIRRFSPKAANAQELRDILGEMTKEGAAELIETGWVRGKNGQRAKTESVREHISPTEYDPPEIPFIIGGVATVETKDKKNQAEADQQLQKLRNQGKPMIPAIHMTSATPTAFETRSIGLTFEVDPVIDKDNKTIDLSLAPEIVTRLEDAYFIRPGFEHTAHGVDNIVMPTFHTMKTTTLLTVIPGNYNLLGIHTPHDDPGKKIIALLKTNLFFAK